MKRQRESTKEMNHLNSMIAILQRSGKKNPILPLKSDLLSSKKKKRLDLYQWPPKWKVRQTTKMSRLILFPFVL